MVQIRFVFGQKPEKQLQFSASGGSGTGDGRPTAPTEGKNPRLRSSLQMLLGFLPQNAAYLNVSAHFSAPERKETSEAPAHRRGVGIPNSRAYGNGSDKARFQAKFGKPFAILGFQGH
jgi:hypothetical protein